MKRLKLELLKKLKKYYRQFRLILETESREFYKNHWVLFFLYWRVLKNSVKNLCRGFDAMVAREKACIRESWREEINDRTPDFFFVGLFFNR